MKAGSLRIFALFALVIAMTSSPAQADYSLCNHFMIFVARASYTNAGVVARVPLQ